jgi:hypothetical protein
MAQLFTASAVMVAKSSLRKGEEKAGHKEATAALEKEIEEARARQPKSVQMSYMAMLLLPVPGLQAGFVERLSADEMGFTRSLPVEDC